MNEDFNQMLNPKYEHVKEEKERKKERKKKEKN
jgi:hypothetical protein